MYRLLLGWVLIISTVGRCWSQDAFAGRSTLQLEVGPGSVGNASLEVEIVDDAGTSLAARVALRRKGAALKGGVDPVGRKLDREGCFYVDGRFNAAVEPGTYELWVRSGFSRVPYLGEVELEAGRSYRAAVALYTWFDPEKLGWYAADFHLHGFHFPVTPADLQTHTPEGKLDYPFMSLACRAAGLNLAIDNVTHSTVMSAEECQAIEAAARRRNFLLQISSEIRIDWQGHVNVPGTRPGLFARTEVEHPLPLRQILRQAEREGGVMVYTHPLRIPWYYWMAATEMPAHVVLEQHGHFFDVARPERTPAVVGLFALWNMGVRIAAAATTDNQFNRGIDERTRTFLKPATFSLESLLQAGRDRSSIASTGAVFASVEIGDRGPGGLVAPGQHRLKIEAQALHGMKEVEVISDGKIIAKLVAAGEARFTQEMPVNLSEGGYVSVIARDRNGGYSIPTAIFAGEASRHDKFHTAFFATEADRVKKTTNNYFLHLRCTVNAAEKIKAVRLLRNGRLLEEIRDNRLTARSRLPNSGFNPGAQHEKCWLFWPSVRDAQYVTVSYPMEADGEYQATIETESGKTLDAGRIVYNSEEAQCWQGGITQLWNERGSFYLETSAHRPAFAEGSDAFRGDWVTRYQVRARGRSGEDLHVSAQPKNYRSQSRLIRPTGL